MCCMFHELPSGICLSPKCDISYCKIATKFAEDTRAPRGVKPSLIIVQQFSLTWLSCSVLFSSFLLSAAVLCSTFSAADWRGEAPARTNSKRLFVPQCQKTHLHSPPCPSTSYRHSAWAWVFPLSSAFNNASSLCPGPHTRMPQRDAMNFFYLAHSLSGTGGRPCLIPLFFIFHFLVDTNSTLPSLHLSNWWPHPTPTSQWLHRVAAAVKATEQSVGGEDN